MFTAEDARKAVIQYEEYVKQSTLTNLVNTGNNPEALTVYENAIYEKANKGHTNLTVKLVRGNQYSNDLEKYLVNSDIRTILKYLGYKVSSNDVRTSAYDTEIDSYTISW
jgi:hypothetical protein